MVVEVGFSESLVSLHELAAEYFSPRPTIRIYLAIKLFSLRQNGTMAMLALLYFRNNPIPTMPVIVRSFGTAPLHQNTITYVASIGVAHITGVGTPGAPACNAGGIPQYVLNIPAAEIFAGSPGGIPPGAANGLNLDLWLIQSEVLNEYVFLLFFVFCFFFCFFTIMLHLIFTTRILISFHRQDVNLHP